MKRLFFILIALTLLCVPVSYAGDVPEVLLNDPASKVFFGKVIECEGSHVVVEQIKNIKGEFQEGSLITHDHCTAIDTRYAIVGKTYLCGLSGQYSFYLWEADSMDTATLKLTDMGNVSQRMQKYLNEGRFEEKEQERLDALESAAQTRPPALNTPPSGQAEQAGQAGQTAISSPSAENKPGAAVWPYAAATGAAAAIAVIVIIIIKKR